MGTIYLADPDFTLHVGDALDVLAQLQYWGSVLPTRTNTTFQRAMTTAPLTEKQFQTLVLELAHTFGWRHYHSFNSRRSPSGYPDLTLVRDRVIFAELKSDTGKPTRDQQAWLDALELAGAEAYLWRPDDLQQIAHTLARRVSREPVPPLFFDSSATTNLGVA